MSSNDNTTVRTFQRNGIVTALSFSFDGSKIAIGGYDKQVGIYNTNNGIILHTIQCDSQVYSVVFSKTANNELLAVGGLDKKATIYNVDSGWAIKYSFPQNRHVMAIAFTSDGKKIAISRKNKTVVVYNISNGEKWKEYNVGAIGTSLCFSPNDNKLAIGTYNDSNSVLRLYSLETDDIEKEFPSNSGVNSISYSPDGSQLVIGNGTKLIVYNVGTFSVKHSIDWSSYISSTHWYPDGKRVAFGDVGNKASIFDTVTGKVTESFQREGEIWAVSFHPNGKVLAIGGNDKKVVLEKVANPKDFLKASALKAEGDAFFKGGQYAAALSKYNAASEEIPTFPAYHSNAAMCYEKLSNFVKMEKSARASVAVDKNFVKGYILLATALKNLENLEGCIKALDDGLVVHSTNADLKRLKSEVMTYHEKKLVKGYLLLATALKNQENWEGCIKTLEDGLAVHSSNEELKRMKGEVMELQRKEQFDEAVRKAVASQQKLAFAPSTKLKGDKTTKRKLYQGKKPEVDVREELWYARYYQSNADMLNNMASMFKKCKIKMVGVQGDLEFGVRTRYEWTALQEDVQDEIKKGTIVTRPQWSQVPFEALQTELEWVNEGDGNRIIIICSCPGRIGDDREIMEKVKEMCDGNSKVGKTFSYAGSAASNKFENMNINDMGTVEKIIMGERKKEEPCCSIL